MIWLTLLFSLLVGVAQAPAAQWPIPAGAEIIRPNPGQQTAAIECPVKDMMFGGARFGGKTFFLILDYASHAQRFGKYAKGILYRRSYPELEEVITISQEVYGSLGWKYDASKHVWTAPNGATLKLRYLAKKGDENRYQGHSYTWMAFDEAGNWASPEQIDKLWACLRSTKIDMKHCVRRLTANPGGPGHGWIYQRYVRPGGKYVQPMRPFRLKPMPDKYPKLWIESVFIPSALEDNPGADIKAYEAQLAAVTGGDDALFRAWRYGDWDAFVGQAFKEWSSNVHVVRNTNPPKGARIVAGLDWGYARGWVGLAWITDRGGEVEVEFFHELYFRHFYARKAAKVFARQWEKFGYFPEVIFADEQMWQKVGTQVDKQGKVIAAEFMRGLIDFFGSIEQAPRLVKAPHSAGSRRVKYEKTHELLAYQKDKNGVVHPWARPRLRFQERCRHAIRTIPTLAEDPDRPGEDIDDSPGVEDHPYDGVGFVILSDLVAASKRPKGHHPDKTPGITNKGRARKKWSTRDDEDEDDLGHRQPTVSPYHAPSPFEVEPIS
jgi:hypothetical protein